MTLLSPPRRAGSTPRRRWKQEGGRGLRETNKAWRWPDLRKGQESLSQGAGPAWPPPHPMSIAKRKLDGERPGGRILRVARRGKAPFAVACPAATRRQSSWHWHARCQVVGGDTRTESWPREHRRAMVRAVPPGLAPAQEGWGCVPLAPGLQPPR